MNMTDTKLKVCLAAVGINRSGRSGEGGGPGGPSEGWVARLGIHNLARLCQSSFARNKMQNKW